MSQRSESDPTSGIRAVLTGGFLSGNVGAFLYLVFQGFLLDAVMNPLAVVGCFLGIGLIGMMAGAVFGLSLRLILTKLEANCGWRGPMALSMAVSGVLGLLIVHVIMSLLLIT